MLINISNFVLLLWSIINFAGAIPWYDDFYEKYDTKRSLRCRTVGGLVPNADCVFPFRYKGTIHDRCTTAGYSNAWCSTKVYQNGEHVANNWGDCDSNCGEKDSPIEEVLPPRARMLDFPPRARFHARQPSRHRTSSLSRASGPEDTCTDIELCNFLSSTKCNDELVSKKCPKKCGICPKSTTAPSQVEFNKAKAFLREIIVGSNIPAVVRLAFHDCVGPKGCDGCINPKQASDKGLQPIIDLLVGHRNKNFPKISNADFWQIAGIVALENGNPRVKMGLGNPVFKGGRPDCPTSPKHDKLWKFPDPAMNGAEMFHWFKHHPHGFNMDPEDVTALMGAHSLGRARKENSGYRFSWTPTRENVFDNEYYQLIYNFAPMFKNENQTDKGPDFKYQWTVQLPGSHFCLMLNTDMELAYDIDVDNKG